MIPIPFRINFKSLWATLTISGILGFMTGFSGYACWHHATEGAQALSGIVQYPFPTPFYIYQVKAWTLLHQIPALLLLSGWSEIQVSLLLSGLVAALSYIALTAAAYAVTSELVFSVAIPFIINYAGMVSYGPVYPILMMGATPSYGVFGHFWMLLTLSLLSLKKYRSAGFFLGIAPAIHVALSVTTYGILLPALLIWKQDLLKRISPFWAAGLALAILSYFCNHFFPGYQPMPEAEPVSKELLSAYMRNWDSHRMPVVWDDAGLWVSFLASTIALSVYLRQREKLPETAGFLLLCSILIGALGFVGMLVSWLPLEWVPDFILKIMPARILNYNILLFPGIAIGVLKKRQGFIAQCVSLFALFYFLIIARFERYFTDSAIYFIGMCALILSISGWVVKTPNHIQRYLIRFFKFFQHLILWILIIKFTGIAVSRYPQHEAEFKDWSRDAFFAEVKKGEGVLLLGPDLSTIQLVTRRPVLIDGGALDIISYLPELARPTDSIMVDVYGISLFAPPPTIEHVAILPGQMSRGLWEARSTEEWAALKKKYNFTEILTSDWKLQLPEVAKNESYRLYRIP